MTLANSELSPEDSLRLNVLLLADPIQAVRIDEGALTLHALRENGEAKIRLHPNCRADQYIVRLKEFLGGHALGSPRGYPVYLQQWTRMGQTSGKNLEALLLLGQHYAKQNQPDRAMFYYERAASIEAFEALAKIRHAQVLVGLRRYADALPLLQRAQEIKPNDDVARYLEQVESIAQARQ